MESLDVVCSFLPCGKSPARDLEISGRYQGIFQMEGDRGSTRLIPRSNERSRRFVHGGMCM
jgi:hypothetical protein